MMVVHRRTVAGGGALPSGSIARNGSSGVNRFEQGAARDGPGPDFFEAIFHSLASRRERGVEFVAGIAFGDSQNNRGAFDRALVEMACHDCPANTQPRTGARLMSLRATPSQRRPLVKGGRPFLFLGDFVWPVIFRKIMLLQC
jgi:hypothetical protein